MSAALKLELHGQPHNAQALLMADRQSAEAPRYRHAWKSNQSKTPRHLGFEGGEITYMRDGILSLANGSNGT